MIDNDIVNIVKESPKILTTIYGDLAQPSVKKVGIALETVLEFSTSFLLPVKLLNSKFRLNFERRLNEYKEKLEQIEEDKLCDVNPQIGTPIIERLSYTTNEEIASLFVNILAKASSVDTQNLAHPGFIQLIERLSVDEARIIKYLQHKEFIPSISFRARIRRDNPDKDLGFHEILRNGTLIQKYVDLLNPECTKTYLDNLTSIGILDISHGLHKIDDEIYEPICEAYSFDKFNESYSKTKTYDCVDKVRSYYQITDYGKAFILACNDLTN